MVLSELDFIAKNLRRWMEPERVATNLLNLPSGSKVMKEPLGVVLIIGPWNYPFQLALCPLISAVAAGNRVVLKPSELTPNTSAIINKIIKKTNNNMSVYNSGKIVMVLFVIIFMVKLLLTG